MRRSPLTAAGLTAWGAALVMTAFIAIGVAAAGTAGGIQLRVVSQTTSTITLGWDTVPNAAGYRFMVDGKTSNTWDGTRTTVKVSSSARSVRVEAVEIADFGTWPPTVPNPPPTPAFSGWPDTARPAFTPSRTVTVATQAAFNTAWAALQPGDLINVNGATFTGQVALLNKTLSGWAEVHFDGATRFLGGGSKGLNAVWVKGLAKVRLYGGDLTNSTGNGFRVEDSDDFTWWGFNVHDVAGQCGLAFGIAKPADRLDLRGELSHCGNDLSLDPHAEKGTGLHGLYLAGGSYRTSGTFIISAHDLPTGAAIEIGPHMQNSVIEVDARRLTKVATQQVAGNALQFWGSDFRNIRVPYLYAEDLVGRAVETDALSTTNAPGTIVVEYARATRVRLTPAYPTHPAVTYLDVALR